MGTTISFMFASAYPDLAGQYIERIFSLAPVAYLDGAPGIVLAKPIAVPLLVSFLKIYTFQQKKIVEYTGSASY